MSKVKTDRFVEKASEKTNEEYIMINYLLAVPEWWTEIADGVYVLVGAILGAISSLLLAWGAKRYGIRRLKKMLRVELDGIKQEVEDNITECGEIILSSPIWNFIGQTSTLLDLKVSDYKKIVAIHGAIIAFKENERNSTTRCEANRRNFIKEINENTF